MTPEARHHLNVLYLFSGAQTQADIRACLSALISEFNSPSAFPFAIDFALRETDLLRGGADTADWSRGQDLQS